MLDLDTEGVVKVEEVDTDSTSTLIEGGKDNTSELLDNEDVLSKKNIKLNICNYVIAIIVGVIVALVVQTFIATLGTVSTGSMTPSIMKGDKVVISKLGGSYKRGDIIVFNPPTSDDKLYTKRIIGVGGDTIHIEKGVVYVNNAPLKESYVLYTDTFNMDKVVVPDGSYFVLGDNRLNSTDSRHWEGNTIKSEKILGKIILNLSKNNEE